MRIGILTWKLRNYGTSLQAYALVSKVRDLGYSSYLLNYSLNKNKRINPLTFRDLVGKCIKRFIGVIQSIKRTDSGITSDIQIHKFKDFYSQIPNDKTSLQDSNYLNHTYSKIIVGSDQVWNPKFIDDTYFLSFLDDTKKYSYAPSLGVNLLTKYEREYYWGKLKSFQCISVREETGKLLLEECGINNVSVVLDPTLLYDAESWKNNLRIKEDPCSDYILIYTLSPQKWYKRLIHRYCYGKKLVIINTCGSKKIFKEQQNIEFIKDVGPIDFVKLIMNASFVITDSFHGMCFSLIFNKQFVVLSKFSKKSKINENSRCLDLLKKLNLENLFKSEKDNISQYCTINYDTVNNILNQQRAYSLEYLKNILDR